MENWKDIRVTYEMMDLLVKIDEKKLRLDQHRPFPSPVVHNIQENLALEWTYNSNSIEGNTLTLQETRMVLEDGLTVSGKSLQEYFEAVNHHEAIDYVEQLVQPDYILRERDILNVHELVMDRIDKEFAGRIRNAGVRISGANFVPPNARKVPDLLEELITWVNEEELEMRAARLAASGRRSADADRAARVAASKGDDEETGLNDDENGEDTVDDIIEEAIDETVIEQGEASGEDPDVAAEVETVDVDASDDAETEDEAANEDEKEA